MGTPNKFPPYICLSDFKHLTRRCDTAIDELRELPEGNHVGYDGRISVQNPTEWADAKKAGYTDINGDGYIDEYDLFLKQFDANRDRRDQQAGVHQSRDRQAVRPRPVRGDRLARRPAEAGRPTASGLPGRQDGQLRRVREGARAGAAGGHGRGVAVEPPAVGNDDRRHVHRPDRASRRRSRRCEFGVTPNQLFDLSPSQLRHQHASPTGPARRRHDQQDRDGDPERRPQPPPTPTAAPPTSRRLTGRPPGRRPTSGRSSRT